MTDQTNNPAPAGTERVETSDDDYSGFVDYLEPDEESDDPAPAQEETDEGEQGETEAVEAEEADTDETEEPAEVLVDSKAKVKLANGETVTVDQLLQERMMKQDHTRKTQEIASMRKTVQADAERIERITTAFIDHLSAMVPPAPDSALALRDPNAYVRQKAQHEAALEQVKKLIEIGEQPKQVASEMTQAERDAMIAEENRKLAERIPSVTTEQGRKKFFANAADVAESVGFTMDDLKGVTDHRIFVLAHYAKIGMDAMKAREVAKAKAQAAPPVAPRKPGQPVQVKSNADAMRKLSKSGSIKDALRIDWE